MATEPTTADVRPKRYRKLRIAWSVFWGVVAALLVVLWVRSYWWYDFANGPIANTDFIIQQVSGIVHCAIGPSGVYTQFQFAIEPASIPPFVPYRQFDFGYNANQGWHVQLPHWFLLLAVVILTALPSLPWLPSRFSLRILLIATTLVAVGLGVVVWMAS